MAPLNVHIIIVVIEGVKSRIARVEKSLRDDNAYKKLEDDYQRRQVHGQEIEMKTELYAKKIVKKKIFFEERGWLWRIRTECYIYGFDDWRWKDEKIFNKIITY